MLLDHCVIARLYSMDNDDLHKNIKEKRQIFILKSVRMHWNKIKIYKFFYHILNIDFPNSAPIYFCKHYLFENRKNQGIFRHENSLFVKLDSQQILLSDHCGVPASRKAAINSAHLQALSPPPLRPRGSSRGENPRKAAPHVASMCRTLDGRSAHIPCLP